MKGATGIFHLIGRNTIEQNRKASKVSKEISVSKSNLVTLVRVTAVVAGQVERGAVQEPVVK